MKKIKSVTEFSLAILAAAASVATLRNDRRTHVSHGEHLPCDCRSSCLSCLRS
jgi:hypothetical protein